MSCTERFWLVFLIFLNAEAYIILCHVLNSFSDFEQNYCKPRVLIVLIKKKECTWCQLMKLVFGKATLTRLFTISSTRREDKSEAGTTIQDVFQTHYLLTDLTPGTLYQVHVAAMRDGRESSSVTKTFATGTKNIDKA